MTLFIISETFLRPISSVAFEDQGCFFKIKLDFLIITLALFKDIGILFKIGVSIFYFLVAFFKMSKGF